MSGFFSSLHPCMFRYLKMCTLPLRQIWNKENNPLDGGVEQLKGMTCGWESERHPLQKQLVSVAIRVRVQHLKI